MGEKIYGFIELYKDYHKTRTNAPVKYGEALALQLLGHTLGYKVVNLIQPGEVHHNTYLVLVGESTITHKTTSQSLAKKVYPSERILPEETSPEKLVKVLSETPEGIQFLGEFTRLLKGITTKGYQSGFAELYNDLHECPQTYRRTIMGRKSEQNTFQICECYLSLNSTTTPEMLEKYINDELFYGGFLARWLLISEKGQWKKREKLSSKAYWLREGVQNILSKIISMEKNFNFVLSDEALEKLNEIEETAFEKWSKIKQFVGRYTNYIISFADIYLLSDIIGLALERGADINRVSKLVELVQLVELVKLVKNHKKISDEINCTNATNTTNCINCTNSIVVPVDYVEKAWNFIKPSLDYVLTLSEFVELEKPIVKLKKFFFKQNGPVEHKVALQNSNLSSEVFKKAVETLGERGEIKVILFKYNTPKGERIKHIYCPLSLSEKCIDCSYKKECGEIIL